MQGNPKSEKQSSSAFYNGDRKYKEKLHLTYDNMRTWIAAAYIIDRKVLDCTPMEMINTILR